MIDYEKILTAHPDQYGGKWRIDGDSADYNNIVWKTDDPPSKEELDALAPDVARTAKIKAAKSERDRRIEGGVVCELDGTEFQIRSDRVTQTEVDKATMAAELAEKDGEEWSVTWEMTTADGNEQDVELNKSNIKAMFKRLDRHRRDHEDAYRTLRDQIKAANDPTEIDVTDDSHWPDKEFSD